jgi:hypothetical protein
MRTTAKRLAAGTAALALTAVIFPRIAWLPGYAAGAGYIIDTAAWKQLRAADASLRLSLGATVGPESDEMMLVWCSLAVSFVLAVLIVWTGAGLAGRLRSRSRRTAAA